MPDTVGAKSQRYDRAASPPSKEPRSRDGVLTVACTRLSLKGQKGASRSIGTRYVIDLGSCVLLLADRNHRRTCTTLSLEKTRWVFARVHTPDVSSSVHMLTEQKQSAALLAAIKEYDANKWKVVGQKVGKPAKVELSVGFDGIDHAN